MSACPICGNTIAPVQTDWDALVQQAHSILREPEPRYDVDRVRLDLAAIVVALDVRLRCERR